MSEAGRSVVGMDGERFGHTVPTGRGTEIRVVPPTRCRNGHTFGPRYPVQAGFARCTCDKVTDRSRGHRTWLCLTPGCGDLLIGDGHTDDSKLVGDGTMPSL